jgi:hypothetical protein
MLNARVHSLHEHGRVMLAPPAHIPFGPQCLSPAHQATLMHCWEAAHSVKCGRTPSEDRSARTAADEKRYSLLSRCTDERESIGYLGQQPARSPCSDATQRHEHLNVGMCASVRLSDVRPCILGCRAALQPCRAPSPRERTGLLRRALR